MKFNKKIKTFLIVITLAFLLVTLYRMTITYGLLESESDSKALSDIGKWNILINKEDITLGTSKDVVIDNFLMDKNANVKEGKIAPGVSGNLELTLDPVDTDVAIKYDLTFNPVSDKQLKVKDIKVISGSKTFVRTGENTFSGVMPLSEINNKTAKVTLKISVLWENNELNNESDTKIGTTLGYNIEVPISLKVEQYFGEELVSYVP